MSEFKKLEPGITVIGQIKKTIDADNYALYDLLYGNLIENSDGSIFSIPDSAYRKKLERFFYSKKGKEYASPTDDELERDFRLAREYHERKLHSNSGTSNNLEQAQPVKSDTAVTAPSSNTSAIKESEKAKQQIEANNKFKAEQERRELEKKQREEAERWEREKAEAERKQREEARKEQERLTREKNERERAERERKARDEAEEAKLKEAKRVRLEKEKAEEEALDKVKAETESKAEAVSSVSSAYDSSVNDSSGDNGSVGNGTADGDTNDNEANALDSEVDTDADEEVSTETETSETELSVESESALHDDTEEGSNEEKHKDKHKAKKHEHEGLFHKHKKSNVAKADMFSENVNGIPKNYTVRMKTMTIACAIALCSVVFMVLCLYGIIPGMNPAESGQKRVVQLTQDVGSGEIITEDMIKETYITTQQYESLSGTKSVNSNGTSESEAVVLWDNKSDVVGKYATETLGEGDYLTTSEYSDVEAGENVITMNIDGKEVTVPVNVTTAGETDVKLYAIVTTATDSGDTSNIAIDLGSFSLEGRSLQDVLDSDGESKLDELLKAQESATSESTEDK